MHSKADTPIGKNEKEIQKKMTRMRKGGEGKMSKRRDNDRRNERKK